jgi:hypothetical protein
MKKICISIAMLVIMGFTFSQEQTIPLKDGTCPDIKNEAMVNSRAPFSGPEYYNFNTNGANNMFPWNVSMGKKIQLLYLPGDFNQPTNAPAGDINKLYFRIGDDFPLGPINYTDLTIKMGLTSITSFATGSFYTGPLTTVYYRAAVSHTGAAGQWMGIRLDTPFSYDPTKSLVIDISQCGATGNVFGYSMCETTLTGGRRVYSEWEEECPFLTAPDVDSYTYHVGFDQGSLNEVPLSNWALFLGIGLVLTFAVIRFRRVV